MFDDTANYLRLRNQRAGIGGYRGGGERRRRVKQDERILRAAKTIQSSWRLFLAKLNVGTAVGERICRIVSSEEELVSVSGALREGSPLSQLIGSQCLFLHHMPMCLSFGVMGPCTNCEGDAGRRLLMSIGVTRQWLRSRRPKTMFHDRLQKERELLSMRMNAGVQSSDCAGLSTDDSEMHWKSLALENWVKCSRSSSSKGTLLFPPWWLKVVLKTVEALSSVSNLKLTPLSLHYLTRLQYSVPYYEAFFESIQGNAEIMVSNLKQDYHKVQSTLSSVLCHICFCSSPMDNDPSSIETLIYAFLQGQTQHSIPLTILMNNGVSCKNSIQQVQRLCFNTSLSAGLRRSLCISLFSSPMFIENLSYCHFATERDLRETVNLLCSETISKLPTEPLQLNEICTAAIALFVWLAAHSEYAKELSTRVVSFLYSLLRQGASLHSTLDANPILKESMISHPGTTQTLARVVQESCLGDGVQHLLFKKEKISLYLGITDYSSLCSITCLFEGESALPSSQDAESSSGEDDNFALAYTGAGQPKSFTRHGNRAPPFSGTLALVYTTPLLPLLFDRLAFASELLEKIFNELGHQIHCAQTFRAYAATMGAAPTFETDAGVLLKSFVSLFARHLLLQDDNSLVIDSNVNGNDIQYRKLSSRDQSEWDDTSFVGSEWGCTVGSESNRRFLSFTKSQISCVCRCLNQIAVILCEGWTKWMLESGQSMRTVGKGLLLFDLCSLVSMLRWRDRRLNFSRSKEFWIVPSANDVVSQCLATSLNPFAEEFTPPISSAHMKSVHAILAQLPISKRKGYCLLLAAFLCQHLSHSVDFHRRARIFNTILAKQKENRNSYAFPYMGSQFPIRRMYIVEDSIQHLMDVNWRERIRIRFVDSMGMQEEGIDGGGVFREYLTMLSDAIFRNVELGFFKRSANGSLMPSSDAFELFPHPGFDGFSAQNMFRLCGMCIAKAIYEKMIMKNIQLNPSFLNLLLGKPNTIDDVQWVDPEVHKNLLRIKSYCGDIRELGLTFSYSVPCIRGKTKEVELMPKGHSIVVTDEYREFYLILTANFITNAAQADPFKFFKQGFFSVIDPSWISIFDADETQHLISGEQDKGFDVDDLRQHTVYQDYSADDLTICFFWETLESWDPEKQSRFLQFATSSDSAPLLGFQYLEPKFAVQRCVNTGLLPSVSTCTNMLRLPDYKDRTVLEAKLWSAITMTCGFYLP